MKKLLVIFFVSTICSIYGQNKIDEIAIIEHINIPGTRVHINIASTFSISDNFTGVKRGNNSMIQVYDLIGCNYYTNAKTFSKETFEEKGAKVIEYFDTTISGYPAKFISMENDQKQNAFSIVYGDTTFSVMMMGLCSIDDKVTAHEIKGMILTSRYSKETKINPLEVATFIIDDSKSKFKFAKYSSSMYIYSLNGLDKKSYDNDPFVTVLIVPAEASMPLSNVSETFILSLEKYGFIRKSSSLRVSEKINGNEAIETILNGKLGDKASTIYLLTVQNKNQTLVFQGRINENVEETIEEMRALAKTIRFKTK